MCRILYMLRYGTVVSKLVEAEWGGRRRCLMSIGGPLIERAMIGRQNPELEAPPAEDLSGTLALIR